VSSRNAVLLLRGQNPGSAFAYDSRDTLTFNKRQLLTCDHDYKLLMSVGKSFDSFHQHLGLRLNVSLIAYRRAHDKR